MKFIRVLFSVLLLLAVVIGLAIGSLYYFVDPNKLKPVLAAEVMKRTGYQLNIDGKLAWSFFPQFGVKIKHMTLTAPNQSVPFAEFKKIRIAMNLSQLLHGVEMLDGKIRIGSVNLLNIHAQNAHIGLHWNNNVLTLQPITASLYHGIFNGTAHGSQFSTAPKWFWSANFVGVQIKPLLEDINGIDSNVKLSGQGQISMQATTEGKTREEIFNHLNGALNFSLKNGAVDGVNLNFLVQAADAIVNKEPFTPPTTTDRTEFDSLTGSALIKNGEVRTDNILLTSEAFTTRGEGIVNLPNNNIDLQLKVASKMAIKTPWEIPVVIEGSLRHPKVRLDANEVGRLVAVQQLEKARAKVSKEIQEHVHGKVGEFLQNLLDH